MHFLYPNLYQHLHNPAIVAKHILLQLNETESDFLSNSTFLPHSKRKLNRGIALPKIFVNICMYVNLLHMKTYL